MGQKVMHALRVRLFTHLQAQSLGFFTRTRGGEVQSRLTHDIAGMQSVVTSSATGVASNLTTAVATAVAIVFALLSAAAWGGGELGLRLGSVRSEAPGPDLADRSLERFTGSRGRTSQPS